MGRHCLWWTENEPKPAGLIKTFEAIGIIAEIGCGWKAETKHTVDASNTETRMFKVQRTAEVVHSEAAATPDSNEVGRSAIDVESAEETS